MTTQTGTLIKRDSLRDLPALVVLVYHFRMMWADCLEWFGWHKWINLSIMSLASGHESVNLFFLLSAFVLSLPYLRGNGLGYPAFPWALSRTSPRSLVRTSPPN
jgi:peptidoglycan/LPS O-acetylase OafA/YrhL